MPDILLDNSAACELHDHVIEQVGYIRMQKDRRDQTIEPLSFQQKRCIERSGTIHGSVVSSPCNPRNEDKHIDDDQQSIHPWGLPQIFFSLCVHGSTSPNSSISVLGHYSIPPEQYQTKKPGKQFRETKKPGNRFRKPGFFMGCNNA